MRRLSLIHIYTLWCPLKKTALCLKTEGGVFMPKKKEELEVTAAAAVSYTHLSELGPVVYMRDGTGNPLIGYAELAERWGVSKATAGRYLHKMQDMQ